VTALLCRPTQAARKNLMKELKSEVEMADVLEH
jgi:hypothetical protein